MNRTRARLARRLAALDAFREAQARQRLVETRQVHASARAEVDEAHRALAWIERRRTAELEGGLFDVAIFDWLDRARLLAAGALDVREAALNRACTDEERQTEHWAYARARREGTEDRALKMQKAYVDHMESRAAELALEGWLATRGNFP